MIFGANVRAGTASPDCTSLLPLDRTVYSADRSTSNNSSLWFCYYYYTILCYSGFQLVLALAESVMSYLFTCSPESHCCYSFPDTYLFVSLIRLSSHYVSSAYFLVYTVKVSTEPHYRTEATDVLFWLLFGWYMLGYVFICCMVLHSPFFF